jgi:hypothetical protein
MRAIVGVICLVALAFPLAERECLSRDDLVELRRRIEGSGLDSELDEACLGVTGYENRMIRTR